MGAECGKLHDDEGGAGGARPVHPAEIDGRRYSVEATLSIVSAGEPPVEMRRPRPTDEEDDAAGCLPLLASEKIERPARMTGFVRRERKVDPIVLLWVLVLGFGGEPHRRRQDLK